MSKVITIKEGSNIKVIVQASNSGGGGGGDFPFDGQRPITREVIGFEGLNLGTTSIASFVNAAFFPAENPTASMTMTFKGVTNGSNRTQEFDGGTTENATLNWTAGRQASTNDITSIIVDGINQTFTNPPQGGTTNGNQAITFPSNVDKSIVMLVTTTGGETANDTISVNYRWKQYLGFTPTNTPSDLQIQGLQNNFISGAPSFSGDVLNGGGSQYFTIVFPESLEPSGGVTIKLGGFDITGDFVRTTQSFTNASGGSSTHVVLTSVNQTSGDYIDLEIS